MLGFILVCLTSFNIGQIAHKEMVGAFVIGFLISLVWAYGVKTAAFGNKFDIFVYCLGAASGTSMGIYLMNLIYN